jgi:hypothetical protein
MTSWRRFLTTARSVFAGVFAGVFVVGLVAPTAHAQLRPVTKPSPVAPSATSSIASPHGPALREPCASCHKANSWTPAHIAPTFRHAERTFPLSGAHQRTTCTSCHKQLDFKQTPTTCATCHTDPHKGEFGATCVRCHNTRSFIDRGTAVRTHQGSRFPLRGAHAIATCESCHGPTRPGQPQFQARGTTCAACHLATYQATKSPTHEAAGFPKDCTTCHSITTWASATFDHATTQFPLTGGHKAVTCQGCHSDGVYRGKPMACASCHQAKFDATTTPHHGPAKFGTACASCHTTTQWRGAPFDHKTTRFPLTGKHTPAACLACHSDRVYAGKPTACVACHQKDLDGTRTPPHAAAGFSANCESCHTTSAWPGARFDHATTRFPLTGGHGAVSCQGCHGDGVYRGKPTTCVSCHQSKFDATTRPNHRTAGILTTCEGCHSVNAWLPATFDHANTRFPLTGGHRAASCLACHTDGVYRGKPTTCISCHQAKFDATTNPHHGPAQFGAACESCHSTQQWQGATYDHNKTRFPLLGRHISATCLACHNDRVYAGKPSICASCHQREYDGAKLPDHRASGFPSTCESCHSVNAWTPASFDHNATRFPLAGGHRAVSCQGCHADNVYRGKPSDCASCHQAKFDATTNPNHRTSGFPNTCESCHSVNAWTPATFDHNATRFPLAGGHRAVSCQGCHADNVYRGKPIDCAGCHQAKFNTTTRPDHRASGFPNTCESCHSVNAWTPATFDHNATRFPLAGGHRAVSCRGCHADNVYRGKPTNCASCHQTKFNTTTRPDHRASGFPNTCGSCHSVNAWTPATFDHNATRFPLAGGHRAVSCQGCHADGVFRGKPTTCVSCHQAKFDGTSQPNHRAAAFPTTCESCHSVTAWTPATFNHAATRFPLTGAHIAQTCLACHNDGVYRGKPTVCSACHTSDYNATTNPNHRTAMFPATCESCHTTTRWLGATFNHDPWFPIYSGKHRQKWTSCAECHANSTNYREFTCLTCHLKTKTDGQHQGRSGYRYESIACLSCHPRGSD